MAFPLQLLPCHPSVFMWSPAHGLRPRLLDYRLIWTSSFIIINMPRAERTTKPGHWSRKGRKGTAAVLGEADLPDNDHTSLFEPNPHVIAPTSSDRVLRGHQQQLDLSGFGYNDHAPVERNDTDSQQRLENVISEGKAVAVTLRSFDLRNADASTCKSTKEQCRKAFACFAARFLADELVYIRTYLCDIARRTSLETNDHISTYCLLYQNAPAAKGAKRAAFAHLHTNMKPLAVQVRVAKPEDLLPQLTKTDRYRSDPGRIEEIAFDEELDRLKRHSPPMSEHKSGGPALSAQSEKLQQHLDTKIQSGGPGISAQPERLQQHLDTNTKPGERYTIETFEKLHDKSTEHEPFYHPAGESGVARPDLCRYDDWENALTSENTLLLAVKRGSNYPVGFDYTKAAPRYCFANFSQSLTRILRIDKSSFKGIEELSSIQESDMHYLLAFATPVEADEALLDLRQNPGLAYEGWDGSQAIKLDPQDPRFKIDFQPQAKVLKEMVKDSNLIWRARNGLPTFPNQWHSALMRGVRGSIPTTTAKKKGDKSTQDRTAEAPAMTTTDPGPSIRVKCSICKDKHTDNYCSWLWRTYDPSKLDILRTVKKLVVYCCRCGKKGHLPDDCVLIEDPRPQCPGKNNIFSAAFVNQLLTPARSK